MHYFPPPAISRCLAMDVQHHYVYQFQHVCEVADVAFVLEQYVPALSVREMSPYMIYLFIFTLDNGIHSSL